MKKRRLLNIIAATAMFHSVLPTLFHKYIDKNVLKTLSQNNAIILTFDDGPDERYTGKLLDVLKENQVRAVFFVVAANAKKHPEIIKRMVKENHMIGFHSLEHKNEMLHSYWYTKKEFEEGVHIMNQMGIRMQYYRPPWGHVNMFSNFFARKHHMRLCLWDVMAGDWKSDASVGSILKKLRKQVHSGSVICLHDAGEATGGAIGAPLKTIEALSIILPEWKVNGYRFILPERDSV